MKPIVLAFVVIVSLAAGYFVRPLLPLTHRDKVIASLRTEDLQATTAEVSADGLAAATAAWSTVEKEAFYEHLRTGLINGYDMRSVQTLWESFAAYRCYLAIEEEGGAGRVREFAETKARALSEAYVQGKFTGTVENDLASSLLEAMEKSKLIKKAEPETGGNGG